MYGQHMQNCFRERCGKFDVVICFSFGDISEFKEEAAPPPQRDAG